MSFTSGMIIGCIGIICFFMSMINIMDDIFKKSKEYLIHWKHFWISMSVLGSLILTTTMKEIAVAEATYTGITSLMNMLVTINIILVTAWFFYLAIFTVLFYINKLSKTKDDLKYE